MILAIAFFDSVIPLVPSETAVIIGGVAAGQGDQVLPLVILCGAAGAFLGDNFAYLIGRRFSAGDQPPRRATAEDSTRVWNGRSTQIRARGGPLLITARFIPGGRTALTVTSGLTRQSHPWFARWIALAAVDLGDVRRRARLHLRQPLQGQPHGGLPARLRRRAGDHRDHRARPPRPHG